MNLQSSQQIPNWRKTEMSISPPNSAIESDIATQQDARVQNAKISEDSMFQSNAGYEYDDQTKRQMNHPLSIRSQATQKEDIDEDIFMHLEDHSPRNSSNVIASYAEYTGKRQLVREVLSELETRQQSPSVPNVCETLKDKDCHMEPGVVKKLMQTNSRTLEPKSQLKSLVLRQLPQKIEEDVDDIHPHSKDSDYFGLKRNYVGLFGQSHQHESVFGAALLPGSIEDQDEQDINPREYLQFVIDLICGSMDSLDKWWSPPTKQSTTITGLMTLNAPIGGKKYLDLSSSYINRIYKADYNKSEEQIASDLMSIDFSLRSTLGQPRALENIFQVAIKLKQMRNRLRDVLISRACLAEVCLRHLQIIEAWLEAYGRQDWILRDLLECSTECVYHFGRAGSVYKRNQQFAASRAAKAARDLALLDSLHGDFYVAMSLHYEAVVSLCMVDSDSATDDAAEQLTKSIALFSRTTPPTPSSELEVKRTILSSLQVLGDPRADGQRAGLFNEILSRSCASPDDLLHAEFLEEVATTLFEIQENGSSPNLLDDLLLITKEAIRIFRLYQGSRSSRVRPALTRALKAYAMGLRCNRLFNEATHILEEAILIQQVLSAVDDADASRYLLVLLYDYVGNHLHLQPRTNPPFADIHTNLLVSLSGQADDAPSPGPGTYDVLSLLSHHVQFIRDLHTLSIIRGLLFVVVPTDITDSPATIVVEILKMLLVISDIQRGLGAFDAALQTSRNTLSIVIENKNTLTIPSETYIDILTSCSHSLIDKDAYGEAYAYLKQAEEIWDKDTPSKCYYPGSLASWAGLYGMVDAHFSPIGWDPSYIEDTIGILRESPEDFSNPRTIPFWLCSIPGVFDGGSTDALAWLLLLQTVTYYNILPRSDELEEALTLLMVYYNQVNTDLEPYAQASVWGHICILLSLIGDMDAQKTALDKTAALYRLALASQPQMTRLPLLVTLQILQIISRDFADADSISNHLQTWKRSIYEGSTYCFDDIVIFLGALPYRIDNANQVSWKLERSFGEAFPVDISPHFELEQSVTSGDITGRAVIRQSNVAVDLPGRTVRFTNQSIESPSSDEPPYNQPKNDFGRIANLTGRIKIVKGPLRAGGFCDIYSGEFTNERGTEKVAMKMLRLFNTEAHIVKAKKKFRREVSLWCSLQHPYVLPFYGTCEFDEFRLFMVAPWAEGGNSLEYLKRNPFADRGRLLRQTASALEYLHSGHHAPPIVHGDLKADNVLISISGDALLCDFGLSVHVDMLSKSGSSSAGRAGGHARFMAPELLIPPEDSSQPSRPTRESDVFAFAFLMLQIYTEKVPFWDILEAQAIMKLASGKLPSRPTDTIVLERGCVDRIWDLMTDCWRFKPSERPSMEKVRLRMKK